TRSQTHTSPIPLPRPHHRPPAVVPRDPRAPPRASLPHSLVPVSLLAVAPSPSYSPALPHATPSCHRRVSSPTPRIHTCSRPTLWHTSIRHSPGVRSKCVCSPAASQRCPSPSPRDTP